MMTMCCMSGHPPRGCRRNQLQDKQRFFLLSAQSGMWVEIGDTIIMKRINMKLKKRNINDFLHLRCEWICEGNGAVCWRCRAWTGFSSHLHLQHPRYSHYPHSLKSQMVNSNLALCFFFITFFHLGCVSSWGEGPRRASRLLYQREKGKNRNHS